MSFNESRNILSLIEQSRAVESNFFNYVFNKILKKSKNRFVERLDDCIDIIPMQHQTIRVIPIFKDMDKNNLCLENEVKIASQIIQNSDIRFIYFVYPKNDNFNKHIQLKIPHIEQTCSEECMIKIIPYSLNDLCKRGKCNGNSNFLCK
jgi:hypothetical protein